MSLVRLVKAAVVRPFIRNEKVAELLYTVEKKRKKKKFIIFQVSLDWYDVYYKSLLVGSTEQMVSSLPGISLSISLTNQQQTYFLSVHEQALLFLS